MNVLEGILGFLGAVIGFIFVVLFKFYGWIVVVAILGYLIIQNNRKQQFVNEVDTILLRIEVPKENEKKELSAEQMLASLHGILRPKSELVREGLVQEHVSFEIVARNNSIQFYVWCPKHLKDFVESQIYAQYPTVQISEGIEDYSAEEPGDRVIRGTELHLNKEDVLPIKTFASFEVDPLAGITGVLAKLHEAGEEVWIQILARPVDDSWQDRGKRYIDQVKAGKSHSLWAILQNELIALPGYIISNFFKALVEPPAAPKAAGEAKKEKVELSTGQQTVIKAVEEKITKLGYGVKIRIAYLGPEETLARTRIQAIVGGFKQFNTTNLNGFTTSKTYDSEDFLDDYRSRFFYDAGSVLNIEELASLYHLPHKSVETPNMVWTTSKTSEPPSNIPTDGASEATELSLFGLTNFRGQHLKFGLKRRDRGRHVYIIGQTGAGKSMLLQLLTLSDVYHDTGFAIVDPHGDYATDIMKYIPEHRLKDVVYFNGADREMPMAFNPMEVEDGTPKNHISSELVGVLKRMFENSWGPRLEYILRYTILALLDYPGATMLDITRLLVEKDFRKKVIKEVQDPVVRNFWNTEFASWNDKFASEAVAPVLNKVGAFVADPLVRNIVGQQKSAFNIRKIMDEGKILIVNLSRGQVGEDNAAILGALMVTKIQLAAMSRADIPLDQRRPFYLYVDEFQNFATDSFAVIMSEARKYGLNLTVANQYVAQMPETVRDAVFGNVGTMISFRVGPGDSAVLGKYYEPVFEPTDLTRLNNQNIFLSMIIDGEKALPFSARTLRMPDPEHDLSDEIVRLSRQHYASDRQSVVESIRGRTEEPTAPPVDAGARAVGQVLATSGDQKPNRPKSEFLAALQNPAAPTGSSPQAERRGDNRDRDGRHDDRSASAAPRKPMFASRAGERKPAPPPVHHDQAARNDAVRQAIQAVQATLQQPEPAAAASTPHHQTNPPLPAHETQESTTPSTPTEHQSPPAPAAPSNHRPLEPGTPAQLR